MGRRTTGALLIALLALPAGAQSVVFENARVRVLTPRIPAGEGKPQHEHPARVIVALAPAHLAQTFADGSTREARLEAGAVLVSPPVRHAVRNLGPALAELVEVELLPAGATRPGRGVTDASQDPAHLTAEIDDVQVRVLRLRLGPHESTALLEQGDRVTIALAAAHLRLEGFDGRDEEFQLTRGDVRMQPAATHTVVNLGDRPVELVSIELKREPVAP